MNELTLILLKITIVIIVSFSLFAFIIRKYNESKNYRKNKYWFYKKLHKAVKKQSANLTILEFVDDFITNENEKYDDSDKSVVQFFYDVLENCPDELVEKLQEDNIEKNDIKLFEDYVNGKKVSKLQYYKVYWVDNERFYNRLQVDVQKAKINAETYNPLQIITKLICGISAKQFPEYASVIEFWKQIIELHPDELIKNLEKRVNSKEAIKLLEDRFYSKTNSSQNLDDKIAPDFDIQILIDFCVELYQEQKRGSKILLNRIGGYYFRLLDARKDDTKKALALEWQKLLKIDKKDYFEIIDFFSDPFHSFPGDNDCNPILTKKHTIKIRAMFKEIEFKAGIELIDKKYPDLNDDNQ